MAEKYMEPFYALCRKLKKNSRVSLNPVAILRTPLPQQCLKNVTIQSSHSVVVV